MIEANNLCKVFGEHRAVDSISLNVQQGEILGFLGPNGAGKSTTMKMLTGYLRPDSGSVTIAGQNMLTCPIAAKMHIGYLPENAPVYADMSVYEFLQFSASIRGLRAKQARAAVTRVIESCFLETVAYQSISTLSKGYRHRSCLAQSILHDPDVIIMDEPTDGLDPNQKKEIRSLILDMSKERAVIFSTHILEEVAALCTRVLLIDKGVNRFEGSVAELKQHAPGAGDYFIRVGNSMLGGLKKYLEQHCRGAVLNTDEEAGVLRVQALDRAQGALKYELPELLSASGIVLDEVYQDSGDLSRAFRALTVERRV